MADTLAFIDERLDNSITAATPIENPIDRLQPLTFTEWLRYNNRIFNTTNEFLARYQSYLNNWYAVKQVSHQTAADSIQNYYTNLINDIIINYSTADERRFLQNIDTSNSRDIAAAIPFFSKKIKDICQYYSTLRDDATTAIVRNNLKGSNTGIEYLLYSFFLKSLEAGDLVEQFTTLNITLSDIRNNLVIAVEDLYDTYSDYYDINPSLPATSYSATTGLRSEYFELNQHDVDPYLFINENQSILKSILSYPFYLIEIGSDLSIDPLVNSSQLNLLKDSDFITTVNDGQTASLNLNNQALETKKYIGSDFYYIVTSSTATSYTSGQLFAADSEFANYLNKRYPSIAAVPSSEFLKTARQIGLFFRPDKIGLQNFTNFKFTPTISIDRLAPDTVYYFPDPYKYGNISGNAKVDFVSPVDFFEENYFNKIDFSNQYRMGDVATDPSYQLFRAYQSREQTLRTTNFGVSRYTDSQNFFNGEYNNLWSNVDVYPLLPTGQYPIETRFDNLLTFNKTLFQSKGDIFGNEYGLYKSALNKQFNYYTTPYVNYNYILQGGLFTTLPSSYTTPNSALGYSGVTLKTSIASPASFSDGDDPIIITSFSFDTSTLPVYAFREFYVTTYNCFVRDAQTFIAASNALLPDTPHTDDAKYNPNISTYYYNELVDGAPQPLAPYGVPTPLYAPSFLIDATRYTSTKDYDGGAFYITALSAEPCNDTTYTYDYKEHTTYRDVSIPGRSTVVDLSLSGATTKKSLYYTRNIEHGDFYFRNNDSTIIGPVSSTLSAVFLNYAPNVQKEINNNVINFDIYYDVIQIETDNYLIFDKIEYDYYSGRVIGSVKEIGTLQRSFNNSNLEKFSNTWFDEVEKTLYVTRTVVLPDTLSASNYKIVYPEIFKINLANQQTTRIYPVKDTAALTFDDLSLFSLYGKNLEVNIVSIEKPIFTYNDENAYFSLSYLGKDTANTPYLITTRFQYINNTIVNMTCTMHKPSTDVYNINFSNPDGSSYFDTYTLLGNDAGYLDTGSDTFAFGRGSVGDMTVYSAEVWEYIQRAGITNQTARLQLSAFVSGLKKMGLWDNTVCWVMRNAYNMGSKNTVYSLGGLGIYNGSLSASGSTAYSSAIGSNYPTWDSAGINFDGSNGFTVNFNELRTTNYQTIISIGSNLYAYNNPAIYGIDGNTGNPVHITTSLSSNEYTFSLYSATSGKDWSVNSTYLTTITAITSTPGFSTISTLSSLSGSNGIRFDAIQRTPIGLTYYTNDNNSLITLSGAFYQHVYDRLEISGLWTYDGAGQAYPKRNVGTKDSLGWPGRQTFAMIIDQNIDPQGILDIKELIKNTICYDLDLA